MTRGTSQPDADWRAMREWLIKTLHDAKQFAVAVPGLHFEAQAEVLRSALNFMDERERAYLVAGRHTAGGDTQ